MSIGGAYRRMPDYLAVFLSVVGSSVVALAFAILGASTLIFLLGKLHGTGDLGDGILAVFFVMPSVAILAFVLSFTVLLNWHHAISWRAPTFAFAMGVTVVWMWGHDWLGLAPYVPGAIAWLVICWLFNKEVGPDTEYVVKA